MRNTLFSSVIQFFNIIFILLLGFSAYSSEEHKEIHSKFQTPIRKSTPNLKTERDDIGSPTSFVLDQDEEQIDNESERSITPNSIDIEFEYDSISSEDSEDYARTVQDVETDVSFEEDTNAQKIIRKLNKKIDSQAVLESDYDNLYIAHFRGFHYLKDRFPVRHVRRTHIKTSHIKKRTYCPAVYNKTGIGFGTPSPTKSQFSPSVEDITEKLDKLDVKEVVPHWDNKKKGKANEVFFSSPKHRLHQLISNSYDRYHEEVESGESGELLGGLDSSESPYVATADEPYHAFRYAYGLKLPDCQKEYAFRPNFRPHKKLKPKHHLVGKVIVFLHPLHAYLESDAAHVPTLGALGEISPGWLARYECETTFQTSVAGKYIVLEEIAKVPSLIKYNSNYHARYGLTERVFNNRKKKLEDATTIFDRIKIEQELMDHIAKHQAERLLRRTKAYVREKKGVLVYQDIPMTSGLSHYSLSRSGLKEYISQSQSIHKLNFPKKQQELKQQLKSSVKEEKSSSSKKLFLSTNPQFYYEKNQSRRHFRVNEEEIESIFQRFLGHRNKRHIRQLLVRSIRNDWQYISDSKLKHIPEAIESVPNERLRDRNIFKLYCMEMQSKRNGIDRQTLEALSHIWNYGEQTSILIYNRSEEDLQKLIKKEKIGLDSFQSCLHFLSIEAEGNESNEYVPLTCMTDYQDEGIFDDFNIEEFLKKKQKHKLPQDQIQSHIDSLFYWIDQQGSRRTFRESLVDGSKRDCGFISIGMDRQEAIDLLIRNATNEETQKFIAPEVMALIALEEITDTFPAILQELQRSFSIERNALVEQLEVQRAQLNKNLGLTTEAGHTLESMCLYIEEHQTEYPWYEAFNANMERLEEINREMENFIPSKKQLEAFVQYEFGEPRRGFLSYFRNGGGTLEAIARLRGIEITVLTGESDLTQTLYVPPMPDNLHKYFLRHTGYEDENERVILNHFNLLEEII